jgi:hypothetical protein
LPVEPQLSVDPTALAGAFPAPTIPTVFADGVMNLAPSTNVVKFYLYRIDPSMKGGSNYLNQAFAQVVMPLVGFAQTAVFFELALKDLVKRGLVTDEQMAAARQPYEGK